jgi:hypothetical protein
MYQLFEAVMKIAFVLKTAGIIIELIEWKPG